MSNIIACLIIGIVIVIWFGIGLKICYTKPKKKYKDPYADVIDNRMYEKFLYSKTGQAIMKTEVNFNYEN